MRASAVERFEQAYMPVTESGCWIWLHATGGGVNEKFRYGQIKDKGKRYFAHRWSYEHFNGPIPDGMCVCHKCDTPLCVNPTHLFLGTIKENVADAVNKGRAIKGERVKKSKLTSEAVIKIKERLKTIKYGEASALAKEYSIDDATLSDIKHGRTWNHI